MFPESVYLALSRSLCQAFHHQFGEELLHPVFDLQYLSRELPQAAVIRADKEFSHDK